MYKPDKKSRVYLYIIFIVASLIGWVFFLYSRPLITETACSEMASKVSAFSSKRYDIDPESNFDSVKAKCIDEGLSSD